MKLKDMNLDYKKIWTEVITASLIIIISAIAIISFIIISDQDVGVYEDNSKIAVTKGTDKIEEVLSLLQSKYMGKLDVNELVDGAIEGIFSKIDDPYTRYLTDDEYDELINSGNEVYSGIGVHISLNSKTEQLVIIGVMPNSPAKNAGIKAGDIILSVDGIEANVDNYNESVDRIKGKVGTTVVLKIQRDGKTKEYSVVRNNIEANNIESSVIKDNIGYIRIFEFSNGIYDQFKDEYNNLVSKQKVKALIIDLRNNPGGLVSDTVKIADMLVKEGIILKTVNSDGTTKVYASEESNIEIPLAVLVNENSASASEILAACIKDLQQGTIIGTTTFGKGIVQSVIKLDNGGAVSITTSKYYTASGIEIHGNGIDPNIVINLPKGVINDMYISEKNDSQLKKAIEIVKSQM
jgi:carboxyl-terminal processing protease